MTIKVSGEALAKNNKIFEFPSPSGIPEVIPIFSYEPDVVNSQKQRATAILECYGGFAEYSQALQKNGYGPEVKKDNNDEHISLANGDRDTKMHKGDIPLQVIPENSPLGKLKKAIANDTIDEETRRNDGIKFTEDCKLSIKDIEQIKEDQKRVIRFAVHKELDSIEDRVSGTRIRTARVFSDNCLNERIKEKCFTAKESPGKLLAETKDGLMSSYITPLTLHLNQSGQNAGKKATQSTRIYYTGFGYPVFTDQYCEECKDNLKTLKNEKSVSGANHQEIEHRNLKLIEKRAELKAIFKQQIFAVLLARQQQINLGEIKDHSLKVPLVLNRPFDFMRAESLENAQALQEFVNATLCQLFQEKDVADAMRGKIDQILIWDPAMDIHKRDVHGRKIEPPLGQVKFFGDTGKFTQTLKKAGAGDIEAVDMAGCDMISVARAYNEKKGIMLAIPGMVNPVFQDGEGAMIGLPATEESFFVASLGMMQIHLNSQHNPKLRTSPILDSDNFVELEKKRDLRENVIGASSSSSQLSEDSHTSFNSNTEDQKQIPDWVAPVATGVFVGLAGAGVTVLCASALGLGIVSAPVVATAVGVGLIAGGLTYIVTNHNSQKINDGTAKIL